MSLCFVLWLSSKISYPWYRIPGICLCQTKSAHVWMSGNSRSSSTTTYSSLPPLHSVTSDAICTCFRMCEGGAEGRPAIWYALQTLPKQRAKHLEQLFHRCSSLWFVFLLKKTFRICPNPLCRRLPEVFIYHYNLFLKNKNYLLNEYSFGHFWQPPSALPPGKPPKKIGKI